MTLAIEENSVSCFLGGWGGGNPPLHVTSTLQAIFFSLKVSSFTHSMCFLPNMQLNKHKDPSIKVNDVQ